MAWEVGAYDQIFGLRMVVSPLLPIVPSDGDNARRIVRHGLKERLPWLDIEPGHKPFESTEMIIATDPIVNQPVLYVSKRFHLQLQLEALERQVYPTTESSAIEKVYQTRDEWLRAGGYYRDV